MLKVRSMNARLIQRLSCWLFGLVCSAKLVVGASIVTVCSSGVVAEPPAVSWNVSDVRGEAWQLRFTTTESTWMSVSVSPKDDTIVFDLLEWPAPGVCTSQRQCSWDTRSYC